MAKLKRPAQPAPRRIGVARVLSKLGLASRTSAARWVRAGRVTVNDQVVRDPEAPVVWGRDRLRIDGAPVGAAAKRYVMLNKPRGLVTTARDEQGRDTVYRCLDGTSQWLAPVGRLDKASEGLLLFSNHPEWAQRLLDPVAHLSRTYHVQVDTRLQDRRLERLRNGVRLANGTVLQVSEVRVLRSGEKNCWLEIILHEGKNRHIRRLLEAMEIRVLRLVRVAIGPLTLGTLAKGQSRDLSTDELNAIDRALAGRGPGEAE